MKSHEKIILSKVYRYAVEVLEFTKDMDFSGFSNDRKTIAACALNLSQIGELAGKLDNDFIDKYNQIPWKKIRGMRHRIVHDYDGLKLEIVWDVIENFLPELIKNIKNIKY